MLRYILSVILILIVITIPGGYFFTDYWQHRFDEIISQQAKRYSIDDKLVWSLIYEETFFQSSAIGGVGEVGLMQITPLVARDWAKQTGLSEFEKQSNENVIELLSDPKRNIQIGCWYYEKLRERYRGRPAETAMTLAAYNAGPSRVEEWTKEIDAATISEAEFIERIGISSTRAYVISILNRYRTVAQTRVTAKQ